MEGLSQMSSIGGAWLPFKALARRKSQVALMIAGLAACVSVTVSLVLFGNSLGVRVASYATAGLTSGFSEVFLKFVLVVVLLNTVAGALITYFLVSLAMSERTRDVGVMKAVGCLTSGVLGLFTVELAMIVLAGCLLGTFIGVIVSYAAVGALELLGYQFTPAPPDMLLLLVIFASYAVLTFILGIRHVARVAHLEPAKALSPLFAAKAASQPVLRLQFPFGRSFTAKIASRNLGRRMSTSIRSIACLAAVTALMTVIVVGGIVSEETMLSYVDRAVGTSVVLVAEADMASHYEALLDSFLRTGQNVSLNYLDEKYAIPSLLISEFSEINGVLKVDARLVVETTIKEIQNISPDPDNPGQYIEIGEEREGRAIVMGVEAANVVNNWLLLGTSLSEGDLNSVLIGDSLALNQFADPFLQGLRAFGSEFQVAGVCLDPLNNGMVVYMSYDRLTEAVKHGGFNLVLLKVDPASRVTTLQQVESVLSGSGLVMLDLDEALARQRAFVGYIWTLLLSLSLLSFVSAVVSLAGYTMLAVAGQQRDLAIMRALGAKPKMVLKIVFFENFLLVLAGALFGLPAGLLVVFMFFLREPVVTVNAALTIIGLMSTLIIALCLSSLQPARKAARNIITEVALKV
jgi:ABC-type antimicrobial peptide transport system permease subunit